jgi:diaminopropionate ammonia-lyase
VSHFFLNAQARRDPAFRGLFSAEEYRQIRDSFTVPPTPLYQLPGLAAKLNVGNIILKDESTRLGLNSFKILGVSYATSCLLHEGYLTSNSVFVCATEGNHGRAVARVARENGLKARIYVAAETAAARIHSLEQEDAEVVIVKGNYDDAVRLAASDARSNSWTIISDTSWPGYEEIPRRIMLGYTKLLEEAGERWSSEGSPDVVLVQAGVGGLACAVVSWLCERYGAERPFTIICEPAQSASLLESTRAGRPVSLSGPFQTIMAGLRCGEVSQLAWPTIAAAADAFVTVDDEQCAQAMRALAHPLKDDPLVVAGASGACGLAALLAILQDVRLEPLREATGISAGSQVFVINTEGATDSKLYSEITKLFGVC